MSVSATYKLTGVGWAECIIAIDGQEACVSASYLSDALRELLRAVVNLLRGVDANTVSFDEEPGEYRWRLVRAGAQQLHVRILEFKRLRGNERDDVGKTVLDGVCHLRSFAAAMAAAAQRVLDEHGADGYRDKWGHDFPTDRLVEIQQLLKA